MIRVVQTNEAEAELRVSAFSAVIQEFNQCSDVAKRRWNFDFSQRTAANGPSEERATACHGQAQQTALL